MSFLRITLESQFAHKRKCMFAWFTFLPFKVLVKFWSSFCHCNGNDLLHANNSSNIYPMNLFIFVATINIYVNGPNPYGQALTGLSSAPNNLCLYRLFGIQAEPLPL
jgi:hypothetical protein